MHFTWDAGARAGHHHRRRRHRGHQHTGRERQPDRARLRFERIVGLNWDRVYPLAGPIAVEGAKPGDTLVVEILDLRTRGWGWTAILPGPRAAGRRLPRRLPEDLRHLGAATTRASATQVAIPLTPFLGTMGVCPADASATPIMPPGRFGGNMDTRQLVAGTTLYLPDARRRRDVLHRRRPRLPGRRRGLRDRAGGADVRDAALLARQEARAARAAVPHGAGLADLAGRPRRRGTARPASGPTCSSTRRTRCGR